MSHFEEKNKRIYILVKAKIVDCVEYKVPIIVKKLGHILCYAFCSWHTIWRDCVI